MIELVDFERVEDEVYKVLVDFVHLDDEVSLVDGLVLGVRADLMQDALFL